MLPIRCLSLVAVLLAATVSDGANILGVFPFPARSHLIVMKSLMVELASRGHKVTVLTPILLKDPPPNYTEMIIDVSIDHAATGDMYDMEAMSSTTMMLMLWGMGSYMTEMALSRPNIQEFIKSKNHKFDLVITESFFNEATLGFAHKFQAPIIQVCPFGGAEWMGGALGNPHSYAYIPDFTLSYSSHMTFLERLHNTVVGLFAKAGHALYYIPKQNDIMQRMFADAGGSEPLPHVTEMARRTSLLLLNHHVSLGSAKPYVPNVIEVGGMHIKPPKKLPQDLQEFLDSATDGVVYFSMGSNLKSSELPADKRDGLLKAFSQLKQKVLWKWEDDVLPGQPPNVKLGKWLPQSDLLAHPNIRLFITHGGLLSTEEAIYNGVPVIGIPIFGDQHMNMIAAVNTGYGRLLSSRNLGNSSAVSEALNDVLNTPRYLEKAREISRRFRDQPRSPMDTAVFWTEYVMRHKGAYHMRSAALDLSWYQYYLLDVIALVAATCLLVLWLAWVVLRALLHCIRPSSVTRSDNLSKKKN